jgi:TonB family protein
MNSKTQFLAAVLLGGLSASALSAAVVTNPVTTEVATYSAPAPMKVVNPTGISRRYQGETIRLSLTVDETGQPHNINLLAGRDPHLVRHLLPVVAKWQFAPAKQNGRPVSAHIVLPIQLVDAPAQ